MAGPPRRLAGLAVLVACGAAIGTLVRAVIGQSFPHSGGTWPWATFAINIIGSLVLGGLVEVLARTGADEGWRRAARLTLGTGVIGGFTSYSTFVVEIDRLGQAGQALTAVAYALVSVLAGLAAAGLGIAAVAVTARRRAAPPDGAAA